MPEPMSPEAPRQPITPALPERLVAPREIRKFPIKIDGKETHYPENYPFSFIPDGPIAKIGESRVGGTRNEELAQAIADYVAPAKDIFHNRNTPPEWLVPILEKNNLSLAALRPEAINILGDNFWPALEQVWDYPFPPQIQKQAARLMGQTEGTVPTLSALMQELQKSDTVRFAELMAAILKYGPDGLVLAAYLAAPKEHDQATGSQANDISYDAWQKVIDSAEYQNKKGE